MTNVLDLFSGVGGFSLGLERAGFRTVAFCEIDPYCRAVLTRHWPDVPCYTDVRDLTADRLQADGVSVDVICGGFPCQDISVAGAGAGLAGERSGLWREFARLIGEIRPRYVLVENVAALLGRGLGTVLGELAALGFDAEWHCIPAAAVGAPHRRDRVWIVANANCEHGHKPCRSVEGRRAVVETVASGPPPSCGDRARARVGDANCAGLAFGESLGSYPRPQLTAVERTDWWLSEPAVGRVADGVPNRVDRLRCLGNAVVPQIPELIGRSITTEADPCPCDDPNCSQKADFEAQMSQDNTAALPKKELAALEKVFAAEINGRLPFQSRAKIYQRLCADGLLEPMQRVYDGPPFAVTVSGYMLTHAGRYLYCSNCEDVGNAE